MTNGFVAFTADPLYASIENDPFCTLFTNTEKYVPASTLVCPAIPHDNIIALFAETCELFTTNVELDSAFNGPNIVITPDDEFAVTAVETSVNCVTAVLPKFTEELHDNEPALTVLTSIEDHGSGLFPSIIPGLPGNNPLNPPPTPINAQIIPFIAKPIVFGS